MSEIGKCKVLLIEDNLDHALIAKMALKKINKISKVDHVISGQKALNYLFDLDSSAAVLPNLIILDLNLPEVNGFEVLKEIRSHEKMNQLPVVVLTTSEMESDVKKALELGVIEYFVKPLDLNKFSQVLDSLVIKENKKNKIDPKIIPICSHCKKIRDDNGLWKVFDQKFSRDIEIDFSHSICPECWDKFYKNL